MRKNSHKPLMAFTSFTFSTLQLEPNAFATGHDYVITFLTTYFDLFSLGLAPMLYASHVPTIRSKQDQKLQVTGCYTNSLKEYNTLCNCSYDKYFSLR